MSKNYFDFPQTQNRLHASPKNEKAQKNEMNMKVLIRAVIEAARVWRRDQLLQLVVDG